MKIYPFDFYLFALIFNWNTKLINFSMLEIINLKNYNFFVNIITKHISF